MLPSDTMQATFHNPILPGFHPDPSICRVGYDFYLVASSFEYFPGVPIFHSRDLVHWRQLGHVLARPSQLDTAGLLPSKGIYAPTLRHHAGRFYMITTRVTNAPGFSQRTDGGGNFIVTADDPGGPWSEPAWLPGAPGIDPSLFFDDDGRAYYCGNREPLAGPRFAGHREIWLQRFDYDALQLVDEPVTIYEGLSGMHVEAPHLYKRNGWYYLLFAEGGTFANHAVSVARSRTVAGPYEPCLRNPIVTHRHYGRQAAITSVGHMDLVEAPDGSWWAVLLGVRPQGGQTLLGRESFLAPIRWEDDWPLVDTPSGGVELRGLAPTLASHPWPAPPACDQFEQPELGPSWVALRTPHAPIYDVAARASHLRLLPRPQLPTALDDVCCLLRRVTATTSTVRTVLELHGEQLEAGLALLLSHQCQLRVALQRGGDTVLAQLIVVNSAEPQLLAELPLMGPRCYLRLHLVAGQVHAAVAERAEAWQPLGPAVEADFLSSARRGPSPFTGLMVGLYAQSAQDNAYVDCDWFELVEGR